VGLAATLRQPRFRGEEKKTYASDRISLAAGGRGCPGLGRRSAAVQPAHRGWLALL